VPRELINVVARPLLVIFERSWQFMEREGIPEYWKKENFTCILKKGKEEDLENTR